MEGYIIPRKLAVRYLMTMVDLTLVVKCLDCELDVLFAVETFGRNLLLFQIFWWTKVLSSKGRASRQMAMSQ
jgi:hypothetical protein